MSYIWFYFVLYDCITASDILTTKALNVGYFHFCMLDYFLSEACAYVHACEAQ